MLINFYFTDPVVNVILSSTSLEKSVKFWNGILGLNIFNQTSSYAELGFGGEQAKLLLKAISNIKF